LKWKARNNKPLTMAQGGGKPTFVVPRGVGSKKMTLGMLRKR
jgi:hypothetical protein